MGSSAAYRSLSLAVGERWILTAVLVCNTVCLADIMTASLVASHNTAGFMADTSAVQVTTISFISLC